MNDQVGKKHIGAPFGNQNSKGHGAPKGNQNAKGHGAPLFNVNALKHGIYAKRQLSLEMMYFRYRNRCRESGIDPVSVREYIEVIRTAARSPSVEESQNAARNK